MLLSAYKNPVLFFLIFIVSYCAQAQETSGYMPPSDTAVQSRLAQWRDLKFGLLMHWGTYSQWGIVESWSICPEDEGWTQRKGPYADSYTNYVRAYEDLQHTFNPTGFDPGDWAKAAKDAGMRYVIFTTKHHDGFAMFDTHQSNYKITDPSTPFSKDPRANVTRTIFDTFRNQGFMTGAYFSKADWHSPYYWWPYFPPKDRHVNYDPAKYPDRWQQFKDYTYNQIEELMTGYGKVDILWLDAGWVRPNAASDSVKGWQETIRYNEDIDMPRIAGMARKHQPGLIVVDRDVPGPYENYTTPEQQVPGAPLDHPWETCMTMGDSWSYVPHDNYKSVTQIVQLLVKIVSRGGNLLLNVGPGPDGKWDPVVYDRLKGVGDWMKNNSVGIYGSRPVWPFSSGNMFYTQSKDGNRIYVYVLADIDTVKLPAILDIPLVSRGKVKRVTLAGQQTKVGWHATSFGIQVVNTTDINALKLQHALCFVIDYK